MEVICEKKALEKALSVVSRSVGTHSSIPALEMILVNATDGIIELTGYDLQTAVKTAVPTTVREEGAVALPASLFTETVRKMPGDITIKADETGHAEIKSGRTAIKMNGVTAKDYPSLPSTKIDKAFEINAAELKRMIDTTAFAVSQNEAKPAFTGVLFDVTPTRLTTVALDGYRLAMTGTDINTDRSIEVIVPVKVLNDLTRVLDTLKNPVQIYMSRNYAVFYAGEYTFISRLIDGQFLDYKRVLGNEIKTTADVPVKNFIESIDRASLLITDRLKTPLRIEFGDDVVSVECASTMGSIDDKIDANITGESVSVGFNNKYILDALRHVSGDRVTIEIAGNLNPVALKSDADPNTLFIVLPVRIK